MLLTTSAVWFVVCAILLFTAFCDGTSKQTGDDLVLSHLRPCPTMKPPARAQGSSEKMELQITSAVPRIVQIFWVSPSLEENLVGSVRPNGQMQQQTFRGHHFRSYSNIDGERTFMGEYVMGLRGSENFTIHDCSPAKTDETKEISDHPRSKEFQLLVHYGDRGIMRPELSAAQMLPRCEPSGDSSKWSCVRLVPADICRKRHKNDGADDVLEGDKFGFTRTNQGRKVGETDAGTHHWGQHAPKFTSQGFLKMNMTKKMTEFLLPWFEAMFKAGKTTEADIVGGGYLNDNVHKAKFINLDHHRHIQRKIASEMQDVLEWYSGTRLKHEATFGVRIYQRGNVLLNHKDRGDTHIASAVLQVSQSVDNDGGWPLEVHPVNFGDCYEVYLQPGEMVLYEGARITHGRPMRLQGDYFANIFSHFRPMSWDRNEL